MAELKTVSGVSLRLRYADNDAIRCELIDSNFDVVLDYVGYDSRACNAAVINAMYQLAVHADYSGDVVYEGYNLGSHVAEMLDEINGKFARL